MRIGGHTRFLARFAPVEMRTGPDGDLVIGERSSLQRGCSVYVADSVMIGSGTQLGPYCVVSDTEVGGLDSPDVSPARLVVIGDGVWMATRVIVRPGSTIGDGAVIGAGSIVDGDIPLHSVAVGSPAVVVRLLGGTGAAGSDNRESSSAGDKAASV